MKYGLLKSIIVFASLLFSGLTVAAPVQSGVSYKDDVAPIIHDYCLNCHQPGGKGYEKSELDMRTYQSLMKGTKFGTIINPGNSFTSIFIQVIEGRVHESIKMPYGMNGGLAKDKVDILKKWVSQGAKDN